MLWKKESLQPDALYIDILAPNIHHWDSILESELQKIDQKPHPVKSDAISLEKRNEGNIRFRDSAPLVAMELYGDSLRFATSGSEHISSAYANRAACFLTLKMYDECLIDIEWAMAAGYPEHLMSKLEQRKAKCLKEMRENQHHRWEKLSIEPDEKFPYLSNMVEIQKIDGDYSMVAKTDIDVCQPIVVENAYLAYISHSFGMICSICAKQYVNLVPCEKCVAMFCRECQGHYLHDYECGLNLCGESDFNTDVMGLVRAMLTILKAFGNVDELMAFVEQLQKNPKELPESMLDDRSKYQAFFNSPVKQQWKSCDGIEEKIYPVYKTLLSIPQVNEMFKTTKHQRFLMHCIGQHLLIPEHTAGFAFGIGSPSSLGASIRVNSSMSSYFKHSCDPNVEFFIGGKSIWYSVKPIERGEKMFVSWAPSDMNSTKKRRTFLLKALKINCECSRCKGKTASPAQIHQMKSEPAFRYFESNVKSVQPLEFNSPKVKMIMNALMEILRKYGKLDWCHELAHVTGWVKKLLNIRLVGGGSDFNHPLVREILSHCDGKCKCSTCNVD